MTDDFSLYENDKMIDTTCPCCITEKLEFCKTSDTEGCIKCPSCGWKYHVTITTDEEFEYEIKKEYLKWVGVEPSRVPTTKNYRIIGTDTFDNSSSWIIGEYDNLEYAIRVASFKGAQMLLAEVYDKGGKCVHRSGNF